MADILELFAIYNNYIETLVHFDGIFTSKHREYSKRVAALTARINKRRKTILNLRRQQLMLLATASSISVSRNHPRPEKSFWELDCQMNDDNFFKDNFRIDRNNFQILCEILQGNIKRNNKKLFRTIPIEKRVAIALYTLGSSAEYRVIGNLFGVGKSTVCTILLKFSRDVLKTMMPKYLKKECLTREVITECVKGFQTIGLPQCLGAIDCCHIEIRPRKDPTSFQTLLGLHSIIALVLVDYRYRFLYASVDATGKCSSSEIFESSSLRQHLSQAQLLEEASDTILDVTVPVYVTGSTEFKLSTNLMVPFANTSKLSQDQIAFNLTLAKASKVAETAIKRLKTRFRRIDQVLDNNINNAKLLIKTCCVLHNYLNEKNDNIKAEWISTNECLNEKSENHKRPPKIECRNERAEEIRHAIASYLSK